MKNLSPPERLPEDNPERETKENPVHSRRSVFRLGLASLLGIVVKQGVDAGEKPADAGSSLEYLYAMSSAENVLGNLKSNIEKRSIPDDAKRFVLEAMQPLMLRVQEKVNNAAAAKRLEDDVLAFKKALSPHKEFMLLSDEEVLVALRKWSLRQEASADALLPQGALLRNLSAHGKALTLVQCDRALKEIEDAKPDVMAQNVLRNLSSVRSLTPFQKEAEIAVRTTLRQEMEFWQAARKVAEAVERS